MTEKWHLPDFGAPPVREVVCGITFKSVDALLAPHLGLLWQSIRSKYPKCVEQQPLAEVIESYGESSRRTEARVKVLETLPLPRIWFLSSDETQVLQVQRDRLLHNWKSVQPGDEYPRYARVIEMFREALTSLGFFLESEGLGTIHPVQYELTYVNHIPLEREWSDLSGIGNLLPDLSWRSTSRRFLPPPESINYRASFLLPNREGRLHVSALSAIQVSDQRELVRLDLTVRGMPSDPSADSMWKWFDLAREWIVRAFVDITAPDVQTEVWRKS